MSFRSLPYGLVIFILSSALVQGAVVICSFQGSDSSGPLDLTTFTVSSTNEQPRPGDSVTITLTFIPNQPVSLGPKGIFILGESPSGSQITINSGYKGTRFEKGERITLTGTYSVGIEGTWNFWPSFQVVTAGSPAAGPSVGGGVRYVEAPYLWHACQVVVKSPPAPCPESCRCLLPASADPAGLVRCSEQSSPCGYSGNQPLYCYRNEKTEPQPVFIPCSDDCICLLPSSAASAGYTRCSAQDRPCGQSMNQSLYCYHRPVTQVASATQQCRSGCFCLLPDEAEESGLVACDGRETICGYSALRQPMFCYQLNTQMTERQTTQCTGGCSCLLPASARQANYSLCGGSETLCGYSATREPMFCYQPLFTYSPVTTTATPLPTVVPQLTRAPTCYDGIQNQGESGIDCGGPCPPCNRCDSNYPLPDRFDWREYGIVTPIRDQSGCGSCWAFSVVAAMESNFAMMTGNLNLDLSEQKFISDYGPGMGSCCGGYHYEALDYSKSSGTVTEDCFEYQSENCGKTCTPTDCDCYCTIGAYCANPCSCRYKNQTCDDIFWTLGDYGHIYEWDDPCGRGPIKRALVCKGPIVTCSPIMGHCFLLVGYDMHNSTCRQKYGKDACWIVKNSHGLLEYYNHKNIWHEQGFFFYPMTSNYNAAEAQYSDLQCWAYWVSGVSRAFKAESAHGDALAVGHFGNTNQEFIALALNEKDQIRLYDAVTGEIIRTFHVDNIQSGEMICAGDINGDGTDEIIYGDRDNWIRVFNSRDGTLVMEFNRFRVGSRDEGFDYQEYDGLAAGDVDGDGVDEILYGSRDGDYIAIIEPADRTTRKIDVGDFQKGEGIAAGDLDGDGTEEIVYGDRDDWITFYKMDGTQLAKFRSDFLMHDGLAAGDLNRDGKAEVVVIHGPSNDVKVYSGTGLLLRTFKHGFEAYWSSGDAAHVGDPAASGDRIAIGDVDGDGQGELVITSTGYDRVNIMEVFG